MPETPVFEECTKHGIKWPHEEISGHILEGQSKGSQYLAFVSWLARRKQEVYQGVTEMPGKSELEKRIDLGCNEATRLITGRHRQRFLSPLDRSL